MSRAFNFPQKVTGFRKRIFRIRILFSVFRSALAFFGNPVTALKALSKIRAMRMTTHGLKFMPRYVKAGKHYFLSHNLPSWPSAAFDKFLQNEFLKIKEPEAPHHLHSVIFSITARCKLKCEHCYESANISSRELLKSSELHDIFEKLQTLGICHVQFSGGEPLTRLDDLIGLLESKSGAIDAWILTSGFELNQEVAVKLKKAGLTGAIISLDHWEEAKHNEFRKDDLSFYWAQEAVQNCHSAGIVTALSLCATKEFISPENFLAYYNLANAWEVGFLRILEPRAVGSYSGKKVLLSKKERDHIEDFFLRSNTDPAFKNFPSVMYPGYYQRRSGCFGSGNMYIYVDSIGDVHACPFCQGSVGSVLKDDIHGLLSVLRTTGCHMFKTQ